MNLFGGYGIIAVILAVLVIYDVFAKQKKMKENKKVIWTVCAILFEPVAAIVYYFVVKVKKK